MVHHRNNETIKVTNFNMQQRQPENQKLCRTVINLFGHVSPWNQEEHGQMLSLRRHRDHRVQQPVKEVWTKQKKVWEETKNNFEDQKEIARKKGKRKDASNGMVCASSKASHMLRRRLSWCLLDYIWLSPQFSQSTYYKIFITFFHKIL